MNMCKFKSTCEALTLQGVIDQMLAIRFVIANVPVMWVGITSLGLHVVRNKVGQSLFFSYEASHFSFGLGLKTPAATDDALLGNAQSQTAPLIPFARSNAVHLPQAPAVVQKALLLFLG